MEEENQQPTIEELQGKFAECEKLREEYLAGWQRERADFSNFKKEQAKLLEALEFLAKEKFVSDLLSAIDAIELAMFHLPKDLEEHTWTQGLKQGIGQLDLFLKNAGIEQVKSVGESFNPEFHEAVGEIEDQILPSGTIVEEIQRGYTLNGKLIRPAKVKVSK